MNSTIESLFCEYLRKERNLSKGTCEIYCRSIRNIDNILQKRSISDCDLYDVKSLSRLNAIVDEALHTDEITEYDKIWHMNRELALRHYVEFAYKHKHQVFSSLIKQVRVRKAK